MKKLLKKSAYFFLPLLFVIIVQLIFIYANWEINPTLWSKDARGASATISIIFAAVGILIVWCSDLD